MSLSSFYDDILVGKDLFSFCMGILKSKKNRKVLILDVHDNASLDYQLDFVNILDRRILLDIGGKTQSQTLLNFDSYLKPAPYEIFHDKRVLRLGKSVDENLLELLRKAPNALIVGAGARETITSLVQEFESGVLPLEGLLGQLLPFVSEDVTLWDSAAVLGNFRISNIQVPNQLLKAFWTLVLLSPRFQIDKEKLLVSLEKELLSVGGQCKKTSILSWQHFNGVITDIELASFEGVIGGSEIHFFTAPSEFFEFSQGERWQSYLTQEILLKTDVSLCGNTPTSSWSMITGVAANNIPVIFVKDLSPETFCVSLVYKRELGLRFKDLWEQQKEDVAKFLKRKYASFDLSRISQVEFAQQYRLCEWSNLPFPRKGMGPSMGPGQGMSAENLFFWGPLTDVEFGNYSRLESILRMV